MTCEHGWDWRTYGSCPMCADEQGAALANKKDLLDCIEELVEQFANVRDDGLLDSMAIGALADAMRLLAANGRMTITYDRGRRVMAFWRAR